MTAILRKFGICATGGMLLGIAGVPLVGVAQAATVTAAANGPVVALSVTERVASTPDMATINTGVTTDAPTAAAALTENNRQMAAVIDRLKAAGIVPSDIQTGGIGITPHYVFADGKPPELTGYQASNRVGVRVRDLVHLGTIIDELVAAGATNLSGPTFGLTDDRAARADARMKAFAQARAEALAYAHAAGYADVRLIEIDEGNAEPVAQPMMNMMVVTASRHAAPVEPGSVESAVSITAKFELTR